MEGVIEIKVKRSHAMAGVSAWVQTYAIPSQQRMTVLEALGKIYRQQDASLAFRRYRCGRRLCRSCEVMLDGKRVRGCATLLNPGGSYLLEPVYPEKIIRDLVGEFGLNSENS